MDRVYIAAPYPIRDRAIGLMRVLEASGVEVTSRWLKSPDSLCDEHAQKDLQDVARADVLVAFNPHEWENLGTGGRHVELGYAVALGKPILLVGNRTNIFHYLNSVTVISESDDIAAVAKRLSRSDGDVITRENAVRHVIAEFARAEAKHKPMHSPHEGYAVILEELDELWDDIKADRGRSQAALHEAVQTAAMGLRYIRDLAPVGEPQSADAVDPSAADSGKTTTRV